MTGVLPGAEAGRRRRARARDPTTQARRAARGGRRRGSFLVVLIAARALVVGVLELFAAAACRRETTGAWLFGLTGIASFLFGVLVLANPGTGALAMIFVIGAYAVAIGVLRIALGIRMYQGERGGSRPPLA